MGEPANQIPQWLDMFVLYAPFTLMGWLLAGVPITLAVPASIVERLGWPLRLLIGAAIGPAAVLFVLVLLHFIGFFLTQGHSGPFSLAYTESFWPFSIIVSTVAFAAYAALLGEFGKLRQTG